MIDLKMFQDVGVLVVGLGRTGRACVEALLSGGARVWAFDDKETVSSGLSFTGTTQQWDEIKWLVLSPGIAFTHPFAREAHKRGIPIVCDINILAMAYPLGNYFGVTGTNGKSTTTALLNHMLKAAGLDPLMGGNIGIPVLSFSPKVEAPTFVLELSSYQLERAFPEKPYGLRIDHGIWLNITPDHLDRHGSLAEYVAAKRQMIQLKGIPQDLVIGIDDPESLALFEDVSHDPHKRVLGVSYKGNTQGGLMIQGGILYHKNTPVLDMTQHPSLKGAHNWQNIACVWGMLYLLGLKFDGNAFHNFKGLPHRQEVCGVKQGVIFVNDSKATNFDSTRTALNAFDHIHLILGGEPKAGGIEGIEKYKDRILCSYLIGNAAESFAAYLTKQGMPFLECNDMPRALEIAGSKAKSGDVVLLSPACASFDQFKDYEHRGEIFKSLVLDQIGAR